MSESEVRELGMSIALGEFDRWLVYLEALIESRKNKVRILTEAGLL